MNKEDYILKVDNLNAGYGKVQALFDISLSIGSGEIVAIIGPNGAGKSTLLKAIAGVIKPWSGTILLGSDDVGQLDPIDKLERSVVYIPQGRVVFDELSVAENLALSLKAISKTEFSKKIEELFESFPYLKDKFKLPASTLSGGMKQMLALARAWLLKASLLLLDEPTLGLSPEYVTSMFSQIGRLHKLYGTTVLIVEQKVLEVASFAKRLIVLKLGKVVYNGPSCIVRNNQHMKELFF